MTNLDVLTGFPEIRVATSYHRGGERFTAWPAHLAELDGLESEYETRPGWSEPIDQVRSFDDLPRAARDYVEWVERLVGVPIVMLSVGPERDEVIPRGL